MPPHTNNEMLFSHKKEENPATCDNMDGIWTHYAKCNKSEKDEHCLVYSHIESLKK